MKTGKQRQWLPRLGIVGVLLFVGIDTLQAQRLVWLGQLNGKDTFAMDVSDEGPVVVGYNSVLRAFRWTEADGLQDLGSRFPLTEKSTATGVSLDGQVVVGSSRGAFRWTSATGMQDFLPELGSDYGFEDTYTWRVGISADGATIVGTIVHHTFLHAFRWTETDGFQDLHPYHPAQGGTHSFAYGVSGDGSVVVGTVTIGTQADNPRRAFRWTEANGMQELGSLGGDESSAYAASADGSVVVGWAENAAGNRRPFRWTTTGGMQELPSLGLISEVSDVSANGRVMVGYYIDNNSGEPRAIRWFQFLLVSYRNLTAYYADLLSPGSYLAEARAVSPNGRYIVGYGYNAETGNTEAFLLDTQAATSVAEEELPAGFMLEGGAPNPFSTTTTIRFVVAQPTHVRLEVFDLLGRRVRTLVDRWISAGEQEVGWDGKDATGRSLPAGVYVCRLTTERGQQSKALTIVR
ncbi:MAG: FlgD immunoglobulin-like domain containing protein [Rhodothermus sp.]|nr:FlgD immunoglobulin-like domain containing protein [Rhodothermus sp.]